MNVFEPALVTTRLFWNSAHRNDLGHAWMRNVILRAARAADLATGRIVPTVRVDETAEAERDGVRGRRMTAARR
jgi:hypothetical protein